MHGSLRVDAKKGHNGAVMSLSTAGGCLQKNAVYAEFHHDGESVGKLHGTNTNGVTLTSSTGDFAECHRKLYPSEHLPEGSVVGFYDGAVTLQTQDARILGVISERPIVLGSNPGTYDSMQNAAMVAYCGRVPVRVIGPVCSGDLLAPSGRSDGLTCVLGRSDSTAKFSCDQIECLPTPKARRQAVGPSVVAVAFEANNSTGEVVVDASILPPVMTAQAIRALHGKARVMGKMVVVQLLLMLCLLAAMGFVGMSCYVPGPAPGRLSLYEARHNDSMADNSMSWSSSALPNTGRLFGPLANTLDTIVNDQSDINFGHNGYLPVPPLLAEAVQCANESEVCPCNGQVRFGVQGDWSAYKTSTGNISCTSDVFGDPGGRLRRPGSHLCYACLLLPTFTNACVSRFGHALVEFECSIPCPCKHVLVEMAGLGCSTSKKQCVSKLGDSCVDVSASFEVHASTKCSCVRRWNTKRGIT